jgi:phosphoribosyl 1,2-cyclic phosphodiesterase
MLTIKSIYSGSSGNAVLIKNGSMSLMIDAGLSGITILKALEQLGEDPENIAAILVTHEHSDHIQGVGIMSRKFNIPIYANTKTWDNMSDSLGNVAIKNIKTFKMGKDFEIGDVGIKPFKTPHDSVESVGYSFFADGEKVMMATDLGHVFDGLLDEVKNCDTILIEANHDVEMLRTGTYPWPLKKRVMSDVGHLSNECAGEVAVFAAQNGCKNILLGHLSHENNFPELAHLTVCNILRENGIDPEKDLNVSVLNRYMR